MTILQSKRLKMKPTTPDELHQIIQEYKEKNLDLYFAYQEMLEGCIKYPREYLWYVPWKIMSLDDESVLGMICFKGRMQGMAEIGYGMNEEHQGKGYATEAVGVMCQWAMNQGITAIFAKTECDNYASQKVLLKNGFLNSLVVTNSELTFILKKE
jgi:ribosomal-protein-alanine N-acetyltransferase